ncbi:hypothetical protein CONLIGDRAFT_684839 [Coniochaeta ligniaria NRRL 30616]|uniref:DUF4982 domain-containing protein n=1 Tax=Coniochaeta ligniaria NRRL 30616 TaxID=1408157 RepID=A0A1J7IB83_9PEZI|nr:hypothetical protein CONLIGDRAFT_684839 [Coniochaeta ligniaria NRRL 30616]
MSHKEDVTRLVSTFLNVAQPNMTFPIVFDVLSINYRGEGVRIGPNYSGLPRSHIPPLLSLLRRTYQRYLWWQLRDARDTHPFVAGEFVWTRWDYIGEPTPYDNARSSYSGIIDLAGFEKNRFYLYQARWRPDLPMSRSLHIGIGRIGLGLTTPVHVFSSGDEAKLFLSGQSQSRLKRDAMIYRFRWNDNKYQPGELYVAAYKDGKF